MSYEEIKNWILLNEPVFNYHGSEYSVCCVNGKYYTDGPNGAPEFADFDDLITNGKLDGKNFMDAWDDIIRQ